MNPTYFLLPNDHIASAKKLAKQRGISVEQLIVETMDRIEGDPDVKSLAIDNAGRVIHAMHRQVDGEWPLDLDEALACACVVCRILEESGEKTLLETPEEELVALDLMSQSTGRSYEQIIVDEILARPENQPRKKTISG